MCNILVNSPYVTFIVCIRTYDPDKLYQNLALFSFEGYTKKSTEMCMINKSVYDAVRT